MEETYRYQDEFHKPLTGNKIDLPIGIMDSGLGGLSVMKEALRGKHLFAKCAPEVVNPFKSLPIARYAAQCRVSVESLPVGKRRECVPCPPKVDGVESYDFPGATV